MIFLVFLLLGGVIKEDFLVDEDSVRGFQVNPEVVVTQSGNFAVAWGDSSNIENSAAFIRFFGSQGNPLTLTRKLSEKTIGGAPRISGSNTDQISCVWFESDNPWSWSLYGQVFDSVGEPLCSRFLIMADSVAGPEYACGSRPEGGSLITWGWDALWGQRYDSVGVKTGERTLIYESENLLARHYSNDINHIGTAVVLWMYVRATLDRNIRFQILDSLNNLVIPDSFYHVCEDSALALLHGRPRVRWLDDERFAIFWLKGPMISPYVDPIQGLQAKIFDAQGDSLTPIRTLLEDSYLFVGSPLSPLSVSSLHNGMFAVAYERFFGDPHYMAVGFLADTSLTRTTGIFRVASSLPHDVQSETNPSVDANSDRIVWVWQDNSQKRSIPDVSDGYYTDIHCKITDWDLLGVQEPPSTSLPDFEIANPIGREIVLRVVRFWDRPEGFAASVFDVSGRKVDELQSPNQNGFLIWGPHQNPGVYFIVPTSGKAQASKVILIK